MSSLADDPVTFTGVLPVSRETAYFLARLLHQRQYELGNPRSARCGGPCWCCAGSWAPPASPSWPRTTPSRSPPRTPACTRASTCSPDIHEALVAAPPTSTSTARSSTPTASPPAAPSGADLWWSGKHKHHGGNIQVLSYPDGFPSRVSDVRPGREHDTTCAKNAPGLLDALTDLGYLNLSPAIRHPHKRPKGGELTKAQTTYNMVIRSVHGVAEHANALLKEALRRTSDGQPRPWAHRRDRQSRTRPTPPRTPPTSPRAATPRDAQVNHSVRHLRTGAGSTRFSPCLYPRGVSAYMQLLGSIDLVLNSGGSL
jgi:hypothetical protein